MTGYIPVTKTGYDYMVKNGFYDKPPYKGREIAIMSLTASDPTPITRGIRLGGFLQIRGEVGNSLQAIFADKVTVQQGLDDAVARGDQILRRFRATIRTSSFPSGDRQVDGCYFLPSFPRNPRIRSGEESRATNEILGPGSPLGRG
ncbi:MAG TPA: hypothetical protein VKB42_20785 [Dongiaceae bacterium]|nr:hypothetical protein [Dongiaceae bacterium]